MQHETKWWAHSMTVWGALVTGITTVLPALIALFGIDIGSDVIARLGDDLSRLVQAIGGLIGTVLTIYGRFRATARLERREVSLSL